LSKYLEVEEAMNEISFIQASLGHLRVSLANVVNDLDEITVRIKRIAEEVKQMEA